MTTTGLRLLYALDAALDRGRVLAYCRILLAVLELATDRPQSRLDFDPEAFAVRHIDAAERAVARFTP